MELDLREGGIARQRRDRAHHAVWAAANETQGESDFPRLREGRSQPRDPNLRRKDALEPRQQTTPREAVGSHDLKKTMALLRQARDFVSVQGDSRLIRSARGRGASDLEPLDLPARAAHRTVE